MNEKLIQIQAVETEIMNVFHRFCAENGIQYSLYAGTALGAVRHKGFIPWDDDIDVCMKRAEYDKFIDLWKEKKPYGYFLQVPEEDRKVIYNHTKLCKENTILASKKDMNTYGHHGFWIDIFVLDRVKNSFYAKKYIFFWGVLRILYTRKHSFERGNVYVRLITKFLLFIPETMAAQIRCISEKKIKKYNQLENEYLLVDLASQIDMERYFPSDILDNCIDIDFGSYVFKITDKYDIMLRLFYGDYWKLPPENEQICKHNPEIVKF